MKLEDLPLEVLRDAWVAGSEMRRRLTPKDAPERLLWKDLKDLWELDLEDNIKVMRASMRAIDQALKVKA